ncbi:M1 family metallopeptidase [Wenyingzhuangia aestuarii]|uniref:M1 family metallopeptidase n=1 Tax=Wenyingzhuangia aestuarii TaxID=1647582 RepID=UPI00143AE3B7|nr:M1 family metallopeptidase [Wenyingzhuangia aestuarii]NJB83715.1 aminopeptidase N [Wenyingzhuangia aestuarii]
MKRIATYILLFAVVFYSHAQRVYRYNDNGKTSTKEFNLIDTKLNLKFDFEEQTVDGEAWIQLIPHFDSANSLQLDAKKMNVYEVKSENKDLKFYNSGEKLNIDLLKTYTRNDTINLYVKYKGNPNKIQNDGGVAITDNKGLYFINPKGLDKNKPTEIWTQGEPEQNSAWFPTIDKPNQKTTEQITLTVPAKYKTLSNGLLISQTENADGTRTDVWKQELPHAPYLFFVGVGEFEIIKDEWNGKEVSYYVEPSYKDTAAELFKNTPEMISFFSELTGIDYPWDKYSQMIVRDYVSGAMENTSAVIHAEQAMLSKGELSERNTWETVIAHELFHHWFGDLVTTESWANITVNESFANYSEYLWLEYKYGKDRADEHMQKTKDAYLNKNPEKLKENYEKHLVRYNYTKKDDVFDVISYNKGGMILHMLRKYLGDEKFFAGLKHYLTTNKFKSAEAHQLRLAMEEVSGEDLMWFFSQWYYNSGHPKLKVTLEKDLLAGEQKVKITQLEKVYDFPLSIDVYTKKGKQNYQVFVDQKEKVFGFPYSDDIRLIKVNGDYDLLAEITQDELTTKELIYQYQNVAHFVDRMQALELLKDQQEEKEVFKVFEEAMNDPYDVVQVYAIEHINLSAKHSKKKTISKIEKLSEAKNPNVKAAAISTLGKLINIDYLPIFKEGIESISPKVKGNSLLSMYYVDKKTAKEYANKLPNEIKDVIYVPLLKMYLEDRKDEHVTFVAKYLLTGMYLIQDEKFKKDFEDAFDWVASTNNTEAIQVMTDDFVEKGLRYKKYNFNYEAIRVLRKVIDKQREVKNPQQSKIIAIIEQGIRKLAVD